MKMKTVARNLLPMRYQVPTKYLYNFLRGTLEKEMKLLGLIVRTGDRVIDVGGNRGIYTYKLWKLGAVVEVFEPNPFCSSVLQVWSADKPGVNVNSVALSNHAGSANLHIPIDESGVEHDASASIENNGFEQSRDQSVSLRTLDSYRFEDVSFIKIDVEGHEVSMIEGATETIASSKPALLVEIEQRHNDIPIGKVFEEILKFGYQGYFLVNGRLEALGNFNLAHHQSMGKFGGSKEQYINNFLFLHRDRLADGEYASLVAG